MRTLRQSQGRRHQLDWSSGLSQRCFLSCRSGCFWGFPASGRITGWEEFNGRNRVELLDSGPMGSSKVNSKSKSIFLKRHSDVAAHINIEEVLKAIEVCRTGYKKKRNSSAVVVYNMQNVLVLTQSFCSMDQISVQRVRNAASSCLTTDWCRSLEALCSFVWRGNDYALILLCHSQCLYSEGILLWNDVEGHILQRYFLCHVLFCSI